MDKSNKIIIGIMSLLCVVGVLTFPINSKAGDLDSYAEKPKLSILGDSISSYYGYGERVVYYGPEGTCVDSIMPEEDTWWRRYLGNNGFKLGWNCSVGFGHASISDTDYLSFSYPERLNRLDDGGEPDYIVVYGGTNDISISHIDASSFQKGYNKLINRLHSMYPETKLILLGIGYFIPEFEEGADTIDIVDGYNDAIRLIADNNGDYYVDLRGALDGTKYFDDTYVHPNKEGMKVITDVVEERMDNARGLSGIENIALNKDVGCYIIKVNAYDKSYDNLRFRFKLTNDRTGEVIYNTSWQKENCFTLSKVDPEASYSAYAEIDNNNDNIPDASQLRVLSNLHLDEPVTVYNGIDYSDVYDYIYYASSSPDLYVLFKDDPYGAISHFVNYGMNEGRRAKDTFDVKSYRNQYADLRESFGWNNLCAYYYHYMSYGIREGRAGTGCDTLLNPLHTFWGIDFSPVYDYEYYNSNNFDLMLAFGGDDKALFYHFLTKGIYEGRQSAPDFNIWAYMVNNPDLRLAFGWDIPSYLTHYIDYGQYEGRIAV